LTRNELKEIIKECLLEIIIEGSPQTVVESVKERNRKAPAPAPQVAQQPVARRPALDLIHPRGKSSTTSALPPRTRPSTANYKDLAGGSDVMASVFADTAASGLVESLGTSGQTTSNPILDTGIDPNLLDGASNWSKLAFAEPIRTRSR
jgi:hypothetical protein